MLHSVQSSFGRFGFVLTFLLLPVQFQRTRGASLCAQQRTSHHFGPSHHLSHLHGCSEQHAFSQRAEIKRFFRGLGGFRRAGFFVRMDAPHQQGFSFSSLAVEGKVCKPFFFFFLLFVFLRFVLSGLGIERLAGYYGHIDTLFGRNLFF
ncbi:hypothetical protein BKA80DRAFT_47168 [Phyllosticta citrichinensis]